MKGWKEGGREEGPKVQREGGREYEREKQKWDWRN